MIIDTTTQLYHEFFGFWKVGQGRIRDCWFHHTNNNVPLMYLRSDSNSGNGLSGFGIKPEGVWFCRNNEWSEWCKENQFNPAGGLKNKYKLIICSFGIKIFQFKNLEDLKKLHFCTKVNKQSIVLFDWTEFIENTGCQGIYFNRNQMTSLLREYEDNYLNNDYRNPFRRAFMMLINMLDIDSLVLWDITPDKIKIEYPESKGCFLKLYTEYYQDWISHARAQKALKRKKSRMNNPVVQEKRRKRDVARRHQKRIRRRERERERKRQRKQL